MILKKTIAGFLAVSFLAPVVVFAEVAPREQTAAGQNFCTRIDSTTTELSSRMSDRVGKRGEHKDERNTKLSDRWQKRDLKLFDYRTRVDGNWTERYAKLDARATTTEQKAVVEAFKNTMNAALAARRAAIDAAIKEYRDGVHALVTARQASVDAAIAAFQSSVNAAIEKQNRDCAAGADPKTVRTTFTDSLKTARDTLKTATSEGKIQDQVKALAKTREQKIKSAMDAYKITAEAAIAALKAAFH